MPIKVPNDLPARQELEEEGLVVISESVAIRQDIRPLRIALLNLMPQKERTETQLARLIGSTPLQVELTLVTTGSYTPTNVSQKHMRDFYRSWESVSQEKFDGFIITGAPVEQMPFEEVFYWDELVEILDWTQTHVHHSLDLCWGAQAALYHFYGVPKYQLDNKVFGVFEHRIVTPNTAILRGFNDAFPVPVSRHTEVRREDLPDDPQVQVLAYSEEAGLCLVQDLARRHIYMFNHLEYDSNTLRAEYERDRKLGLEIELPKHYFPEDDPAREPPNFWRSHAHLMIGNWINAIYQTTSFELARVGEEAGRTGGTLKRA